MQGQERSHAREHHEIVGPGHGVGESAGEVFDLPTQRADWNHETVRVGTSMDFLLTRHMLTIRPPTRGTALMPPAAVDDAHRHTDGTGDRGPRDRPPGSRRTSVSSPSVTYTLVKDLADGAHARGFRARTERRTHETTLGLAADELKDGIRSAVGRDLPPSQEADEMTDCGCANQSLGRLRGGGRMSADDDPVASEVGDHLYRATECLDIGLDGGQASPVELTALQLGHRRLGDMHPGSKLDLGEPLLLADLAQPIGAGLGEHPVLVLGDGVLARRPLGANLVPGPGPLRRRNPGHLVSRICHSFVTHLLDQPSGLVARPSSGV